ncbi:MAG TPA: AAA family ATPase [Solirubrobacteraceae bacterium]|nr:AAA family ATPase [Solirubrobacteraceae bacterium]
MSRRHVLRGRDAPLAELSVALDRVRGAGAGAVILIEGAPGMGKTRLLDEAARMASRMDFVVGRGSAEPGEGVELAPLMDALFGGDPSPLEPGALRELPAVPEQRYWLLQELQSLLERAALRRPIFLALDDLQWADAGTAAALRVLTSRLHGLPIAWAIALRPPQGSSRISSTARYLVRAGAERIVLAALDQAAVVQIGRDLTGGTPADPLVALMARAQGSPFLLTELLTGLLGEEHVRVEDGEARLTDSRLPARVHASMRERLGSLSDAARESAVLAGSLGRTFSFGELAAMLERPPSAVLAPVEELIDCAILVDRDGDLGFGHDITRDAVRASVPSSVRRALDRQAVDVLLKNGAQPADVAAQLAESAAPGDEGAAATLSNAARIVGANDPSAGADLSRRALELVPSTFAGRAEMVTEIALLLHAAGRSEEGRAFVDTHLRSALPAEEEARVLLTIAGMFALSPDLRIDAGRRALALEALSPTARARHHAALFHNFLVAGRFDEGREVLDETRKVVRASNDGIAAFSLLLAESAFEYIDGNFMRSVELTQEAARSPAAREDPTRERLCQEMRSEALMVAEKFEESLRMTNEGIADAERSHQGWALHLLETWRGRQLFQLGRLDDAAPVLEGQLGPEEEDRLAGLLDAAGIVALGRVALHRGDDAQLHRTAALARTMVGVGPPGYRRHASWLLALAEMAAGDPAAAHGWLCALGLEERKCLLPLFPADVTDEAQLVRIAVAADDEELAVATVDAAERRAKANPTLAAILGTAAHARGILDGGPEHLERAVEQFERSSRPLALSSVLEDLGARRIAAGAEKEGIEDLERALRIDVEAGAAWDARRVRARLRARGIRRRVVGSSGRPDTGWAAMTDSELAVARLVARGLTNRDVAERLFVSPHTVNSHLRQIFAKLQINSRVALTRLADDHDRSV